MRQPLSDVSPLLKTLNLAQWLAKSASARRTTSGTLVQRPDAFGPEQLHLALG